MNKNTLILIIVLVVAFVVITWMLLAPRSSVVQPPVLESVLQPTDAARELTEGTTITDIEQDLESLLQEDDLLGDLEAELQQMEELLEFEGL